MLGTTYIIEACVEAGLKVVTPLPLWTALAGAALALGIAALEAEDLRALGPLEDHPTRTLCPPPEFTGPAARSRRIRRGLPRKP